MPAHRSTYDCVLIGGGVIGLSLACELGRAGLRVCVLERGEPGREASWAGAGIIPPGATASQADPLQRLIAYSSRLHPKWAGRLLDETGIDTEYRPCGGYYVAQDSQELDDLVGGASRLRDLGVDVQWSSRSDLEMLGKSLGTVPPGAYFLPGEARLRNPRHLKALSTAAERYGVTLLSHTPAISAMIRGDRIAAIQTPRGPIEAGDYCLTAGSWTGALASQLGFNAEIKPIRGQVVLLRADARPFESVINAGLRYLVPRDDGRILVGSTMEDVGFDCSTTAECVSGLLAFALRLAPKLASCAVERTWAGLRPAAADGLPILGRLPHWENGWIASGHFRNGLTLSTGTAEIMACLIRGEPPTLDPLPFSPARFEQRASAEAGLPRRPLATPGA